MPADKLYIMSNLKFGPKINPLGEEESISSVERWRQNVLYHLRLNEEFRPYLKDNVVFGKKSKSQPTRSFTDEVKVEKVDGNDVTTVVSSAEDKCFVVDLMLDQVSNFCPLIPRRDITHDSATLLEVWEKIRLYHNLERSGALLNECFNIKRKPSESHQALFARLKQSFDDNLLVANGLSHSDGKLNEDEEMSPTLLNSIILIWLNLLHPRLREVVTQRFSTDLRNRTFASLFPEISRSVGSLLEELNGETSTNRVFSSASYQSRHSAPNRSYNQKPRYADKKCCDYCKLTGKKKFYTHSIESCFFVKRDKAGASAKQVEFADEEEEYLREQQEEFYQLTGESFDQEASRVVEHTVGVVNTSASPVLSLNKDNKSYELTLDTGCTGCSVIPEEAANDMKATIKPTMQRAKTANGKYMNIIGEVEVTLYRGEKPYYLEALVSADPTDLLAGMPFLKVNDIAVRPATNQIIIDGKEFVSYDSVRKVKPNKVRKVSLFTVQSESRQVILPGQSGLFSVKGVANDEQVVVEPRWYTYHNKAATKDTELWPAPQVVSVVNNSVSLSNNTSEPIVVKKSEHIGSIHPEVAPTVDARVLSKVSSAKVKGTLPAPKVDYSASVVLNPDSILSTSEENSFKQLMKMYEEVFSPVRGEYNGRRGSCLVEVNMGNNLPPQRKGHVPFYSRDNLELLQEKFDELEEKGVFSRPQDIGVTVENISPSFLVTKQNSTDKRLVTDFTSISEYCRPTPSLLPDVDSTLRNVGGWKYIIKTDMTGAYYQLKLMLSSKRYCGVHTPFKGLRVYNVGCMGLPGVETALEELTCLLFGDLVKSGKVAKLADDIFIGGETPAELLENFEQVLRILLECNVRLSPTKTTVAPKSIVLLGWIWSSGKLSASSHKLAALSTCSPPETASALKSFICTFRFISRVIPRYAKVLAPLELANKGKDGKERVNWSTELLKSFHEAQKSLLQAKSITVPKPSDTLWIVTDAALRPAAIGGTLYCERQGKPMLSGFFNAKVPEYQTRWLPCELEGLAVAASLNHYAPYIIQSKKKPQVLTDSKPCVQAVQKLRRGEFSASARLTSFLSAVSRYGAQIQHISGSVNLPSDYSSRHPLNCNVPGSCQVCLFIKEAAESVVNEVTVSDMLTGKAHIPFTNRAAWMQVQSSCPDLRKVMSHKKSGTVPNKKSKNLRVVRKYLSANVLVASDGLLVHRLVKPLSSSDQIVVPQDVLDGILTALHLKLKHPTGHQLSKVFARYFFALNLDKKVSEVTKSCHHCSSIKEVPSSLIEQSTSEPPSTVGSEYSADVMKRCRQKIFVLRETTTSFTLAEHIEDETVEKIQAVLLKLSNILKPSKLCPMKVKLDSHSSHKSMYLNVSKSSELVQHNIVLELGRPLNPNKNPICDKAIKELHREILNIKPSGGPISSVELSEAVASLNGRIRSPGLSSYELWTQRDQVSGDQLPLDDRELIMNQHQRRLINHPLSEKSKAKGRPALPSPAVKVGSLVYVYGDRDKTVARCRYMVCGFTESGLVKLRRFSAKYFSSQVYEVKPNDIYTVPEFYKGNLSDLEEDSSDEESFCEYESDTSNKLTSQDHTSEASEVETVQYNDHREQHAPPTRVPPGELTDPDEIGAENIRGRLRRRKNINYCEESFVQDNAN